MRYQLCKRGGFGLTSSGGMLPTPSRNSQTKHHMIDSVVNSNPNAYPDISLSNDNSNNIHAEWDRKSELSMFCFDAVKYDCCGVVQPTHCDPDIELNANFPFEQK